MSLQLLNRLTNTGNRGLRLRADSLLIAVVSSDGGPHRHAVLLVEDDWDTREGFTIIIEQADLGVIGVRNGREALETLTDGFRPCIIVLDMAMPEMDGFAFRRAQLADPTLASIPVAVISGAGWAVERDARALGLTTFLRKPIDPAQLVAALATNHCGAQD